MLHRLMHPPVDPAITPVNKKPALDFSFTGVVYMLLMLFMGLAAMNTQANLLFGVFGLMIGILLVSGVISRLVLRKLDVQRILPDHMIVGREATIQYQFTNRKRFWPSLSLCLSELDGNEAFTTQPRAYLLHAAAKMTASVPALVVPKRRGLHSLLRYQLSTGFPFGFVKRAAERQQPDSVLIYPPLARVDRQVLSFCLSAEKSGATMRPRRGGTDEFYGLKEYRQGDNPRWIHWRRSARTGTLVSREMTQVAPPRLLVVVDTHLPQRLMENHIAVERCIAMAASLAEFALGSGMAVGAFAWSDGWAGILPNGGKRHGRDLLTLLARLPQNTSHDRMELIENSRKFLRPGTTAVLFTAEPLQTGPGEAGHSAWTVIPVDSPRARQWFRFDEGVDFSRCMPAEQRPVMGV